MRSSLFILVLTLAFSAQATIVRDTLYFNAGVLMNQTDTIEYWSIDHTPVFDQRDEVIRLASGDTLDLTVINNHNKTHLLYFPYTNDFTGALLPGDTSSLQLVLADGIHLYEDRLGYGKYMGMAGAIHVSNETKPQYYWHLREQTKFFNKLINGGHSVNLLFGFPDFFTINGTTLPSSLADSTTLVTGNVNDTIHVHFINVGRAAHSMHSHGFHMTIIGSTAKPWQVGWEKDTWPVLPGQVVSMRLVPDKNGKYPMHDHNLISITNDGNSPGGMSSQIRIGP